MPETTTGSIYDLGYQRYTGARLGRRHAVASLYWYSLLGAFGIGRPLSSKIGPMTLSFIAMLPAIVQLGIASLSSGKVEALQPYEYYNFIFYPLAIFTAVVAPDIAGRDQRNQTLSLYFSRALLRFDYAAAKFLALVTAMLALTFFPQSVAFIGNGAASDDFGKYLGDKWTDLPAALASAFLISALFAAVGLGIAAQTGRRAYSTVGIVATLVLSTVISLVTFDTIGGDAHRYTLLASPFHLVYGFTYWIFGATLGVDSDRQAREADLWGGLYVLATLAWTCLFAAVIFRRYQRVQA